jgi:hypothetical protein
VRAVLPTDAFHLDEPQVRLVEERGGLQGVARTLVAHVLACEAAQLLVNDRDQRLEGGLLAAAPREQESSGVLNGIGDARDALHSTPAPDNSSAVFDRIWAHLDHMTRLAPRLRLE